MSSMFEMADEIGPEKIIHVFNKQAGLRAIVVLDNTAMGPAVGGVRMAPDANLQECGRLARAMSRKNAAAGLPHGGGKSVIVADPAIPKAEKQRLIRAFAHSIAQIRDYIPGPDMGTDEICMAWVKDEIQRAVGLPRAIGGIPLDEIGATGLGVAVAARVAQDCAGPDIDGATVAIQGYGAVGRHAARFLVEDGARVVAVADSGGTALCEAGFELDKLDALKRNNQSVTEYPKARVAEKEAVLTADCDILIPAARPDAINISNAGSIKAKLIIEGANIPTTAEAEKDLHARGVIVIPDFIANAGGVICASVEYRGGTEQQAVATIAETIDRNTNEVLRKSLDKGVLPRDAANALAEERLLTAMEMRRVF